MKAGPPPAADLGQQPKMQRQGKAHLFMRTVQGLNPFDLRRVEVEEGNAGSLSRLMRKGAQLLLPDVNTAAERTATEPAAGGGAPRPAQLTAATVPSCRGVPLTVNTASEAADMGFAVRDVARRFRAGAADARAHAAALRRVVVRWTGPHEVRGDELTATQRGWTRHLDGMGGGGRHDRRPERGGRARPRL